MSNSEPNSDNEYCDRDKLVKLYHDKGLTQAEIAEKANVANSTIVRWMGGFDIEASIDPTDWLDDYYDSIRVNYANYRISGYGYPMWECRVGEESKSLKVHRLLAVAKYGVDTVKGMDVHHKNNVKWDNRIENIELKDKSEHRTDHAQKRDRNKDGTFA